MVLIVLGVGLVIFGCVLMYAKHSTEGSMRFRFLGIEIEIQGHPARGAVAIVLGIITVLLGLDLERRGRFVEPEDRSSILSTPVLAQDPPPPQDPLQPPFQAVEGWAYLGAEDEPDDWTFETLIVVSSSPAPIEFWQAKRPVTVLTDHYEGLTGTFVGSLLSPLLGDETPDEVGRLSPEACVLVTDRETVGADNVWLRVRTTRCEPISTALERTAAELAEVSPD